MAVFLLQKVLKLIAVLFGVSLLTFSVLHLIPGDPVRVLMGDMGGGAAGDQSEAAYDNMRTQLGLDQPLPVQYVRYIGNALQGDLGRSFQTQRTIMSSVADSLPSTLVLTGASMVITVVLGVLLGVLAAVRYHTWWDTGIMVLSLIGLAMPSFWLGMLLLMVFSFQLQWFPVRGSGFGSLILPAITLGLGGAGVIARLARASLLEVLQNEYVTTARAKGLKERLVITRHALSNALIPVVTVAGLQFGQLLAGAFIVETVFARPGIGRLLVTAVLSRDYPMVQGVALIAAVGYVFVNFLVDFSYAWLDPRIRHS
jgi:ABC-type dipeptide/oligopeptide/nickel transport system permease component